MVNELEREVGEIRGMFRPPFRQTPAGATKSFVVDSLFCAFADLKLSESEVHDLVLLGRMQNILPSTRCGGTTTSGRSLSMCTAVRLERWLFPGCGPRVFRHQRVPQLSGGVSRRDRLVQAVLLERRGASGWVVSFGMKGGAAELLERRRFRLSGISEGCQSRSPCCWSVVNWQLEDCDEVDLKSPCLCGLRLLGRSLST